VFALPGSSHVDQNGDVSTEAGFVFSQPVRSAAERYLSLVAAALPLPDFWAIRLTSGGDGEMLYPPGGTYWAFAAPALTGTGLAAGMTPTYPNWRPGQPGLRPAQLGDLDDTGAGVLMISPHLDDAVLSCGALFAHRSPRHPITVATVFTAAASVRRVVP
jgi:hypothetical protein